MISHLHLFIHIIISALLLISKVQNPHVINLPRLQSRPKKEKVLFIFGFYKLIGSIHYYLKDEEAAVEKGFATCKLRPKLIVHSR